MPEIHLNGHAITVDEGTTLLQAAKQLGIEIPTLCHWPGNRPSCMVCVVQAEDTGRMVPACSHPAVDGMRVITDSDAVWEARKTALELLLSDHVGDCMSPCHRICPLEMNIPRMLRQVADEDLSGAAQILRADIALPQVTGWLCHHPCEGGCRRRPHDGAVTVRDIERLVAERSADETPYRKEPRGRSVAIVGAGPCGLTAASQLLRQGYACTLFDRRDSPGGALRAEVDAGHLPAMALNADIEVVRRLGAGFRLGVEIGESPSVAELSQTFDAVLLALGTSAQEQAERLGLDVGHRGLRVDRRTGSTSLDGVFAAGGATRGGAQLVRAMADGKDAAVAIQQLLSGLPVTGPSKSFSSIVGRLREGELDRYLEGHDPSSRTDTADGAITMEQAKTEAARCLHCDCRAADTCLLRRFAEDYGADARRFKGERIDFEQQTDHSLVIYEPGKCIKCGRCVAIAAAHREDLGLTFVGRGFQVRVGAPFRRALDEGLKRVAAECAQACPTGAIALRDDPQ